MRLKGALSIIKKTFFTVLVAILVLSMTIGCSSEKSAEKGITKALSTVINSPSKELTDLLFREDTLAPIVDGLEKDDIYDNGYFNLLRDRLSQYFTTEGYKIFSESKHSSQYQWHALVTKQSVEIEKIEFTPDNGNNEKLDFTVTALHTNPENKAQTLTSNGYVRLKDGKIDDFYLDGTILYELEKTVWKPEDVPTYPMP